MPVNLVSEEELRAALRPYRVDPATFEAGVRTRLEAAQRQRADDPLAGRSPFLRSAAAFLPLALLAGCKASPTESKLAPAAGGYKLLSYLAFPAISLFVLLGATVFSVMQIRRIRAGNDSGLDDQQAIHEVTRQWWSQHKWAAVGLFAATLTLAVIGATWLLFLFYIMSFGILLSVLAAFAKLGLGNRQVIGQSCLMGLLFLGQVAGFSGIGHQEIHFLDQTLVAAVFFGGVLILMALLFSLSRIEREQLTTGPQWVSAGVGAFILIPLLLWMLSPMLWPAGPLQIKGFVESFDNAPHQEASWHQWEIPARWAIESKLKPDLTLPRRLLDKEIATKSNTQNPFILGIAMRVGLLPAERLGELRDYPLSRKYLLTPPPKGSRPLPLTFLPSADFVIRAAVLRNDLSAEERDMLEQQLHATLDDQAAGQTLQMETILRVTQLLEVIDRPINRNQYRERVHNWLREFHTTNSGGFQLAGGFKTYRNWPAGSWLQQPGALEPTSHAIELMQIYGVPEGIDLNWVRSFLKPTTMRISNDKWMAAAIRERLNHLSDTTPPTWLEFLHYERSLLAAAVLVGLCFYATISSPKRAAIDSVESL